MSAPVVIVIAIAVSIVVVIAAIGASLLAITRSFL